jgi:hypothetical protein
MKSLKFFLCGTLIIIYCRPMMAGAAPETAAALPLAEALAAPETAAIADAWLDSLRVKAINSRKKYLRAYRANLRDYRAYLRAYRALRHRRFMTRLKANVTLIKFQRFIKKWYIEKTFTPEGTFDLQCRKKYAGVLGSLDASAGGSLDASAGGSLDASGGGGGGGGGGGEASEVLGNFECDPRAALLAYHCNSGLLAEHEATISEMRLPSEATVTRVMREYVVRLLLHAVPEAYDYGVPLPPLIHAAFDVAVERILHI